MEEKKRQKTGGRVKGSIPKKTQTIRELAESLGCNPLEILMRVAMNDWKGLGYDSPTKAVGSVGGIIQVDRINLETRVYAADKVSPYLYPKLSNVALTGAEGTDLFKSFGELVKSVLEKDSDDDTNEAGN